MEVCVTAVMIVMCTTGCVDTLTCAQSLGLSAVLDDSDHSSTATAAYSKDDYSVVNRFESTLCHVVIVVIIIH